MPIVSLATEYREVQASEILKQIENGEDVNVTNCRIIGELNLSKIQLETVPNPKYYEYLEKGVSEEDLKPTGLNKNLKVVKSNIIIHNSTFESKLDFSNILFKKSISLTEVDFKSFGNFAGANFGNKASFKGTVFGNIAFFCGATFGNGTNFEGTTFGDGTNFEIVTFGDSTNFGGATFGDSTSCHLIHFGDGTSFLDTTFGDKIDFSFADFVNGTSFFGATFTNNTFFYMATFKDYTNFGGTTFGDNTLFIFTTFGNYTLFAPIFDSIHIIMANYNFRDTAIFGKYTSFEAATFGYGTSFSGATFADTVDFSDTKFKSVSLNDTDFKEMKISWDSLKTSLVFDGPTYVKLIRNFRNLEQFDDANNAYYQYRAERRKYEEMSARAKISDLLMQYSCGYGVKPSYTVRLTIFVILLFFAIYLLEDLRASGSKLSLSRGFSEFLEIISRVRVRKWKVVLDLIAWVFSWDAWNVLFFSVASFVTLDYKHWNPHRFSSKLAVMEGFLGTFIVSLLIVTLANVMINV